MGLDLKYILLYFASGLKDSHTHKNRKKYILSFLSLFLYILYIDFIDEGKRKEGLIILNVLLAQNNDEVK